jgi:hypothetical protein
MHGHMNVTFIIILWEFSMEFSRGVPETRNPDYYYPPYSPYDRGTIVILIVWKVRDSFAISEQTFVCCIPEITLRREKAHPVVRYFVGRNAKPHTPVLNQEHSMVNVTHEIWGFQRNENSDCGLVGLWQDYPMTQLTSPRCEYGSKCWNNLLPSQLYFNDKIKL